MAIVTLKRLRLLSMQENREELLQKLQRLGCVEISDTDSQEVPQLKKANSSQLDLGKAQYQAGVLALEILNGYSKANTGFASPRPQVSEKDLANQSDRDKAWEYIQQITQGKADMGDLQGEKNTLLQKKDNLSPWASLDVPLDSKASETLTLQFGSFPTGTELATAQSALLSATDLAELSLAQSAKEGVFVLLTSYTPELPKALEALKPLGFNKISFRSETGTAKENIQTIDNRLAEIEKKLAKTEETLARMGEYRPQIQKYLDGNQQIIAKEEAKSHLLDTEHTFYLDGWVEAEKWSQVESILDSYDVAYEVEDPTEEDIPFVPVKLKNGKLSRSMSVVTEMYSLPAYNGVDPNPLMAPFFVFFYGMMMADMGYGLLMVFATQYMLSKAKPKGGMRDFCELFRMLGYSTLAWGALTAGFFGNFVENFLLILNPQSTFTWFWPAQVDPMNQSITILIVAMCFGAVHLLTGMMVSFAKKTKDGKFMDAVMDEGSWWLLFAGAGMGAMGMGWIVCYAGVAAIVLTQGRHGKGIMKLVGGVAKLYDITGYFGDILSYARLMALMLAGSVIASVFNDLGMIVAEGVGGGVVGLIPYILIAVLGNALNFGLNLLGCFVHTLRLQCLEFFGKFYMDGGKAFRPLNMDTKYVDVQGQEI